MIPSIEQVMNRRSIVCTIIRATCTLLLFIGLMPVVWEMCDDLLDGDLFRLLSSYLSRKSDVVSWFIVNGAVAAALWLLQGRVLRWLVPWPQARCPQCEYRLERITTPRCPECGCDLPAAMVRPIDPTAPAGDDEHRPGS